MTASHDEIQSMSSFIGLQAMDRRITEVDERHAAHIVAQVAQIQDSLQIADAHLRETFSIMQEQMDRRMTELDKLHSEMQSQMDRRLSELSTKVNDGDKALEKHIGAQADQILSSVEAQKDRVQLALKAAEDLETERLEKFNQKLDGTRREVTLIQEAAAAAISKADAANEKRFEAVNEFRQQLNDQAQLFLPRETFDSVVIGWSDWRSNIDARLNQQTGQQTGADRREAKIQPWALWAAGAFVTTFITAMIIIINLVTAS